VKKETVRTLLIVLGVLILLAIVGLGSAVWLFMRSFQVGKADAASATQQFDGIRARFAGVTPVLEVRDEEPVIARRPPADAAATRLSTMHVLAWDPDDDELVRIDVPFWLLRLKSGPIEIASDHTWMSDNNLGITVEELERFGPTLILDQETREGGRVLIWTE
jgi:hypothetical protein